VQELQKRVLGYIRQHELLQAGDRVGVAVSGGADSVALLRVLLDLRKELGIVVSVVHFNHHLRGDEADADEKFVADLAKRYKLQFHSAGGDVKAYADEKHLSVETAARKLRYAYFEQLLADGVVNRIATGHTLDDQAETVLMRVARGAGTRGLAGIYPRRPSGARSSSPRSLRRHGGNFLPSIIRPLLSMRRTELESYLRSVQQNWREDASNRDLRFTRNRIRHGILPRLERALNPSVREALADTAEIARAEEEYWEGIVAQALPCIVGHRSRRDAGATLNALALSELPLALQRRVAIAALESLGVALEFKHVEEVLAVADGSAKAAALPHDWALAREGSQVIIQKGRPAVSRDYEYRLPIPGRVAIPEAGIALEAVLVSTLTGYNPEHCLDSSLLSQELSVRNWRSGDRFWPAHTKAPKKIKELLQERRVLGLEKKLWPVVTCGSDIVWVRGFAVPAQFRTRVAAGEAVMIREIPGEERATK
jgi:tRNA(Ile)-lysidine synthase